LYLTDIKLSMSLKHSSLYLLLITSIFLLSVPAHSQTLIDADNYLDRSDYKNAIAIYSKLQGEAKTINSVSLLVQSQNGIASCYMELGARYKALSLLKQNAKLLKETRSENYLLSAKTHQLIADNYNALALYEDYLEQCHLFYSFYQKAYPDKEIFKALYYAYLGRYYNIKLNIDKAYYYTSNGLKIYHKNKKENFKDSYLFYNAHLFTSRNYNSALCQKYIDSLSYSLDKRFPYDNLKKARLLVSMAAPDLDVAANNLYNTENPNHAMGTSSANKCIALYGKGIKGYDSLSGFYHSDAAFQNSLRGLMYFYKKDYKKALENYDEGIQRLTIFKQLGQTAFNTNNYQMLVLLRWKTWVLEEMYDQNKDAKLLYKINANLLLMETVWTRYSHELINSKEQFFTDTYNMLPYQYLVKNYCNLYQLTKNPIYLEKIFEYDEKSKYASLLENLHEQKKTTNENKINFQKLNAVNEAFENVLLKTNNKIPMPSPLAKYQFVFKEKLAVYQEEQKQAVLSNKNKIISLNEVQNGLTENEALLSYPFQRYQNHFHPYALVILKNNVKIIPFKKVPGSGSSIGFCVDSLMTSLKTNDIAGYKKHASSLYEKYFEPVERVLPKQVTHITIMPDAELSNLPFGVLLTNDSRSSDFRKLPYLAKRFDFSYSLSASISKLNSKSVPHKNTLSVFTPSFQKKELAQLTASHKQGQTIAATYSAQLVEGKSANLEQFRRHIKNDKVVAVFSHGQGFNDYSNTNKGIYFSDGFLDLKTIYGLQSHCDFLILAACETGVGLREKGEGNVNLARAFSSIGVKSMMLSSWKIDEETSLKITQLFLKYLQEGYTKSEALQKAKLEFLASASPRTASPIYWAGLNIVGNNDTISLKEHNYYWWSFALIFPVIGGFWYRKKRKIAAHR
jgi:CHAT domain-containing protein